jgi:AcrR family transcriptional regulator
MDGKRRLRAEARREQILAAALELFRKQGFEGTTTRQIAAELGMSNGNLYTHFRSKDELLAALMDPLFEKVESLLDQHSPTTGDPQEQRTFLEAYFDLILENREQVALLGTDVSVLVRPGIGERAIELNERLRRALAGPRADCADQVRAACALAALQAAVAGFPEQDLETLRSAGLRAALRGLTG